MIDINLQSHALMLNKMMQWNQREKKVSKPKFVVFKAKMISWVMSVRLLFLQMCKGQSTNRTPNQCTPSCPIDLWEHAQAKKKHTHKKNMESYNYETAEKTT